MRIESIPIVGAAPVVEQRSSTWPARLNSALIDPSPSILERLSRPGTLVVTTGQQPAIVGGPLYSVHKAVAAAALARELATRWGRDVVPIFWIAGDDHDHVEASRAAWFGADGTLHHWSLAARSDTAPQLPMYRVQLGAEVLEVVQRMSATMPAADAGWMERWWHPGETIHSAYAGAMAELLAPLGVACIDPTREVFKTAQAPLLAEALRQARDLDAAIAALGDAGTGITAGDGASLVFLETDAGRERLVADGPAFRTRRSGASFSLGELERLLATEPQRFSANVLLRPVVESALLPTVAYVAGPGEHRYLTRQAAALYPLLGVTRQAPVPRWGGAVIEGWMDRILGKLGLTAEAVTLDDGSLARTLLRRDMPPAVQPALARLRGAIGESAMELASAGKAIDAVLDRAIDGRIRRAEAVVDDLERLLERHLRRRVDIAHGQFQRVRGALLPDGAPQERVLSVGGTYAQHGNEWPAAALEAAERWAAASPRSVVGTG